jgi:uncharacterized membrane-anchored protein
MARDKDDRAEPRRVARTLGLLMFGFMTLVAIVIAFTQDTFDAVDILLLILLPPVSGALAYVVGLYHRDQP